MHKEEIEAFSDTREIATLEKLISEWIGARRWFSGERKNPSINVTGFFGIENTTSSYTALLTVLSGKTTYFLPLTFRAIADKAPVNNKENLAALVGIWKKEFGHYAVLDATEDPHGQLALLRTCFGESGTDITAEAKIGAIRGFALRGGSAALPRFTHIQPLRSEQSNTSIIYHFAAADSALGAGIILKLFRIAHIGANPDIELQQALDKVSSGIVPAQYGSAHIQLARGEAAIMTAQEFISGAKDAWQVFQEEFNVPSEKVAKPEEIIALGKLTRDIHLLLAQVFPTVEVDALAKETIIAGWIAQTEKALECAPELLNSAEKMQTVFRAAAQVAWPLQQRIHGDFHLGQVLNSPNRGWVALDFEGEPLRPLAERSTPSLALRDVAGMLRSFSYAAGAAELSGKPATATRPWAENAKELFMQGYGTLAATEEILLRALLLEKALYEVVYEATYRPRWLPIPVEGIENLLNKY